jgi:hypothetical protein
MMPRKARSNEAEARSESTPERDKRYILYYVALAERSATFSTIPTRSSSCILVLDEKDLFR